MIGKIELRNKIVSNHISGEKSGYNAEVIALLGDIRDSRNCEYKRKHMCTVTVSHMRNPAFRAHCCHNQRSSNNKRSSKCSGTSTSDPDGASLGYIYHVIPSSTKIIPQATFVSTSSVEVFK